MWFLCIFVLYVNGIPKYRQVRGELRPTMLLARTRQRGVSRAIFGVVRNRKFVSCTDSNVQVVRSDAGSSLVTTLPICALHEVFTFTGKLTRFPDMYSLQVGAEAHLVAHLTDEVGSRWMFMNHSFSPSIQLTQQVTEDQQSIVLTARAICDMAAGDEITFDYTLHEWEMAEPFRCRASGRLVAGWSGLTDGEKEAALPRAMPHIRSMHLKHLFGQESRC